MKELIESKLSHLLSLGVARDSDNGKDLATEEDSNYYTNKTDHYENLISKGFTFIKDRKAMKEELHQEIKTLKNILTQLETIHNQL